MDFKPGEDREEKIDKFLDTLAAFHSYKETPVGFYSTVGRIEKKMDPFLEKMDSLITSIKDADKSSTKVADALNRITLTGVGIAAAGFGLEAYKLFFK
jgi:hypothetical protein